jgi:hypothetical protein
MLGNHPLNLTLGKCLFQEHPIPKGLNRISHCSWREHIISMNIPPRQEDGYYSYSLKVGRILHLDILIVVKTVFSFKWDPLVLVLTLIFLLLDPNSSNFKEMWFQFLHIFSNSKTSSLIENQIQFHVQITHSPKNCTPQNWRLYRYWSCITNSNCGWCKYRVLKPIKNDEISSKFRLLTNISKKFKIFI